MYWIHALTLFFYLHAFFQLYSCSNNNIIIKKDIANNYFLKSNPDLFRFLNISFCFFFRVIQDIYGWQELLHLPQQRFAQCRNQTEHQHQEVIHHLLYGRLKS